MVSMTVTKALWRLGQKEHMLQASLSDRDTLSQSQTKAKSSQGCGSGAQCKPHPQKTLSSQSSAAKTKQGRRACEHAILCSGNGLDKYKVDRQTKLPPNKCQSILLD